jgi:uncharacterized protein (DUF1778 family)
MKMNGKKSCARNRLSIDIDPEEHQKIKVFAVLQGKTIREYVLESIRERLNRESEEKQLLAMEISFFIQINRKKLLGFLG